MGENAPTFIIMMKRSRFAAWKQVWHGHAETKARAALEDLQRQPVPDPYKDGVKQPDAAFALYELIEPVKRTTLYERRRRRGRLAVRSL